MENITLIIPAKYESESLPVVLEELKKFNFQVKIVLEKNDIKTIDAIKNNKCEILFQEGKGYGNAIRYGINKIDTEYFCIFNADGSFIPDEIPNMLETLNKQKADFVFASRYEKNAKSDDDNFITFIGNHIFSMLGKIFFKLPITDILYTFVLGKVNSVRSLKLKENDFRLCVELPIKAVFSKMTIVSLAAHERPRIAGWKKVNAIKDGFLIFITMVKYYLNKN